MALWSLLTSCCHHSVSPPCSEGRCIVLLSQPLGVSGVLLGQGQHLQASNLCNKCSGQIHPGLAVCEQEKKPKGPNLLLLGKGAWASAGARLNSIQEEVPGRIPGVPLCVSLHPVGVGTSEADFRFSLHREKNHFNEDLYQCSFLLPVRIFME